MTLVHADLRSAVDLIVIDNPPVNSFGRDLRREFADTLHQALENPASHAILIAAKGRLFSAGADITEFGAAAMLDRPHLREIIALLDTADKPIVVAIHGIAAGGAVELALSCHYRVAAPMAHVALPEVQLGLVPGAGGTQRLPRLIGARAALDMITTGAHVPAAKAHATGLIDAVIEGDLIAGALQFIENSSVTVRRTSEMQHHTKADRENEALFAQARAGVAAKAPGLKAPAACIDCVEFAVTLPFEEGLEREREIFAECLESEQSAGLRHAFFAEREVSRIADLPPNTKAIEIGEAGVIGCGTMGQGITINFANAGIPVWVLESDSNAADAGLEKIRKRFESRVKRGRMTQESFGQAIGLIHTTVSYDDLSTADIVIEAVFEEMEIKQDVFTKLDAVCKPGAILATNTSTLDINEIASVTTRPDAVIGTHFFSPADVMKLMENVRGEQSSPATIMTVMQLSKRLKKIGVLVGVCDGFVGNRMLFPYFHEAEFLLEEGAAPQQVDRAMREFGFAMGPFAVGDLAGLDVGWRIRTRHAATRDPALRYSPIADRICEMGRFGQKTGAGWYRYEAGSRTPTPDPEIEQLIVDAAQEQGVQRREISDQEIVQRCMYPLINEGARILEENMAQRAGDIDIIWLYGYGFPRYRGGPMFYADHVGLGLVYKTMLRFQAEHGDHMAPCTLLATLASQGKGFFDA